jgi:hypothetical protein
VIGPDSVISATVQANTVAGGTAVSGRFASDYARWALAPTSYAEPAMRPNVPDPADWSNSKVGWGIVLPKREGLSAAQLARADDAPEPIRTLVAEREGKVLRYCGGSLYGKHFLRDYTYEEPSDLFISGSQVGMGELCIPQYLLLYGTPAEVPWHIQYALNPVRSVGRLDLAGDGLANYVTALRDGWADADVSYADPVVWAVDHDGDITSLMRTVIAEPLHEAFQDDPEMPGATFIGGQGESASVQRLYTALATNRPALIVTTSHGRTEPLSNPNAMRSTLGLPIDQDYQWLSPTDLLKSWQPDGAIWFAHACCSAGSDSPSAYAGLFEAGGALDQTTSAVAALGASTSPLAAALLGAPKPLRAFIGHVEPTFNWTISFPLNDQPLTPDLQAAVYDGVASGQPVGLSMARVYRAIGSLLQRLDQAQRDNSSKGGSLAQTALDMALYLRVTAHDRASTVILGDPTAALALPASAAVRTS